MRLSEPVKLIVLVPTKGRPGRAATTYETFLSTAEHRDTWIEFILDDKDPLVDQYKVPSYTYPSGTMIQRTNMAAMGIVNSPFKIADIIGFAADDNLFVTPGWDCEVVAAFKQGHRIVNTNDMLVGDEKGGVFFFDARIVKSLGYLLLPSLGHLWADFAATELGKASSPYYKYLHQVIIEHEHPYTGKVPWDAQYREYNNPQQDAADRKAFYEWRNGEAFQRDVAKVMFDV